MCHPAYAGAQPDEKAQSRQRRDEQYILKRFATQLLGLRWGFENISKRFSILKQKMLYTHNILVYQCKL
jgi:hypothetical protein